MSKQDYFQKAISWAESLRLSEMKVNFEGYEAPNSFNRTDAEEEMVFTPDITGKRRTNKYYIEIAMKDDNNLEQISKWKLLGTMASMKGGKLYLLAPKGHKAFVDKMLAQHQFPSAEVVYLQ
ncbi:MAG: hypothetical protein DA408_10075 [Bacteroidetes bacterium]|nr:MAG: hypothetical protein C7N36_02535 [Bacteroidota bacterium]PTM12517.1 MAG: hypothetical protein DA408_10075 [Bacteroidota bacterium]